MEIVFSEHSLPLLVAPNRTIWTFVHALPDVSLLIGRALKSRPTSSTDSLILHRSLYPRQNRILNEKWTMQRSNRTSYRVVRKGLQEMFKAEHVSGQQRTIYFT